MAAKDVGGRDEYPEEVQDRERRMRESGEFLVRKWRCSSRHRWNCSCWSYICLLEGFPLNSTERNVIPGHQRPRYIIQPKIIADTFDVLMHLRIYMVFLCFAYSFGVKLLTVFWPTFCLEYLHTGEVC